ncbi:MAG: CinA family protein [Bdellovibrionaceae bacterium]|nr:CinA family protein [Pseudobdellovibrionaceae bacterium]
MLFIHNWFIANRKTLGFAESCTGGLLSSLLTQQAGASKYFMGAVVSYSGKIKESLLKVPAPIMKNFGEVSLPVAKLMAQGARQALQCDWSIAITGIAGPGGGSVEKPVGTLCFAVCGPDFEYVEQQLIEGSERRIIQQRSAEQALKLLKMALQS